MSEFELTVLKLINVNISMILLDIDVEGYQKKRHDKILWWWLYTNNSQWL